MNNTAHLICQTRYAARLAPCLQHTWPNEAERRQTLPPPFWPNEPEAAFLAQRTREPPMTGDYIL